MSDAKVAKKLLADQFAASAALIALMLDNLSDEVRARVVDISEDN